MGWPQSVHRPHPSHPLLEFVGFPPCRLHCHVGKTMVEPVCLGRAWIHNRQRSQPEAQDGWNGHLAIQPRDGMFTPHAPSHSLPPWLRPLRIPLLHQQNYRQHCHRFHYIWSSLLPPHSFSCYLVLQLSIPNPPLPYPSILDSLRQQTQKVPRAIRQVAPVYLLPEEESTEAGVKAWQSCQVQHI